MPGGTRQHGHPEVWAFLTIITFPIVLITTDILGAEGLWPFGYAILATFCVLVLEAIVRGRLWPFEAGFIDHIGHPATPLRILIFLGATLLVLETTLIFAVATDRRFDPALLGIVINKQCAARQDPFSDKMCRFLLQPFNVEPSPVKTGDLSGYAIRAYARNAWFPNEPLATCAERSVERMIDASTNIAREVHLVHCTAWKVDENGFLKAKSKNTAFIGSALEPTSDGLFRVVAWTEDPNGDQWKTTLGKIAEGSRDRVLALAILPEFELALQIEALASAQELLKK